MKDIKDIQKTYDQQLQEIRNYFIENLKSIFEQIPDLLAIQWSQYTPTFNDGDPCVMRVESPRFLMTKKPEYETYSSKVSEYDEEDEDGEVNEIKSDFYFVAFSKYEHQSFPYKNQFQFFENLLEKSSKFLTFFFGEGDTTVRIDRDGNVTQFDYDD